MDAATLKHLQSWLERNERPEDWDRYRKEFEQMLEEDPELVELGWTRLREIVDRDNRQSSPE